MASYTVPAGNIGAQAKTLVSETADTVTFEDTLRKVEVRSNGSAKIYFTVNGSTPTVGGSHCYELPAAVSVRTVDAGVSSGATVVKLIANGTPEYSVAKP